MQRYQVQFVRDSELPDGVDYTFATIEGRTFLFMKRSAVDAHVGSCDALTRSFTLWERAQTSPPPRRLVAV